MLVWKIIFLDQMSFPKTTIWAHKETLVNVSITLRSHAEENTQASCWTTQWSTRTCPLKGMHGVE